MKKQLILKSVNTVFEGECCGVDPSYLLFILETATLAVSQTGAFVQWSS